MSCSSQASGPQGGNPPCGSCADRAALLDSTTDPIWAVDLDYGLVTYNAAFAADIAKCRGVQIAVGMRPDQIGGGEACGWGASIYDRALTEGRFTKEIDAPCGRGLELTFSPIRQDGKTTGISVFGRDVTERRMAAKALRAAESRYRAIFDGAVLGVFQFGPDRRLVDANSAMAEILGYDSPEEIISTLTPERFWENPDDAVQLAKQIAESQAVPGYETRVKRKDGTSIWVSLSSRKGLRCGGRALVLSGLSGGYHSTQANR